MLVDLSDCNFIDSTGLSLLVETKRRLSEDDRRFGVCCPDADVRRLLELTGIDQAVGLFDTRDGGRGGALQRLAGLTNPPGAAPAVPATNLPGGAMTRAPGRCRPRRAPPRAASTGPPG